jgi:hypothetical protein
VAVAPVALVLYKVFIFMPVTVKSVLKGYEGNENYPLNPRQLASILRVLETSKDYLSKPMAVHLILSVDSLDFDKSLINAVLIKALQKDLKTGFGFYFSFTNSNDCNYFAHILLTFSSGNYLPFTILKTAVLTLKNIPGVTSCCAQAKGKRMFKELPNGKLQEYYIKTKSYFHKLSDNTEFKDAVYWYSSLAKIPVDSKFLKCTRLTQSKFPVDGKTKQAQTVRKNAKRK